MPDAASLFDPSDFHRELTPGVRLLELTTELHEGKATGKFASPRQRVTRLVYVVHDARVSLTSGPLTIGAPPIRMEIEAAKGITTELLRAVPLADARSRIKTIARSLVDEHETPRRLSTDREWAEFAQSYGDLVAKGDRTPIEHLVKATGTSRNTIAQRVRHARKKGLLTKPANKNDLGELTDHARAILERED